jgi:hypothetical protein
VLDAQVYGGVTYVDCAAAGGPVVEYLPAEALPQLWLMHAAMPSESGKVHAPVRERWKAGDNAVVGGMRELAALATTAR